MKRLIKTVCAMLSLTLLAGATLSLAACEDIKKVEVIVAVYDIDSGKQVEKTVEVSLYRHLADDTVDAIKSYVENGFYDGLSFYKFADSDTNRIMIGNLKAENGTVNLHDADYVKNVEGEFNAAGVVGSDLKNTEGSIGLWRTWFENGGYNKNSDAAFSSGRATLYMPTSDISAYDGYFCVFGKFDLEDSETKEAVSLIKAVLGSSDYSTSYTVYYTGEYGNLTYHCDLTSEYEEKIKDETFANSVFNAKGEQFVSYNSRKIIVPVATVGGVENYITAKVISAKLK